MVGETIRKILTKAITSLIVASIVVGCFSNTTYAAVKKSILLDIHTDVLSLVMNSADELVVNPYDSMIVCDYNPYLAIRETADYEGKIVGKLYSASYGDIIEKGDEWTKIQSGDVTGYVPTKDVSIGDEAEALAEEIGTKVAKVNVEQLNIRSGPNFYSPVVYPGKMDDTYTIVPEGYLIKNDVIVNEENGDEINSTESFKPIEDEAGNEWYRIHMNGCYYGYVYADCVDVVYELNNAISIEEEERERNERLAMEAWKYQSQSASPVGTPTDSQTNTNTSQNKDTTADTSVPTESDTTLPETDTQAPESTETTVPETEITSSGVSLTEDEIYLLACLLYCEAGPNNYDWEIAVANVVLNRLKSPHFPNTLSEVIYQPGQFGPASNNRLATALLNGPGDLCMQAAKDAVAGVNNIGNLMFFHDYAPSGVSAVQVIGPIVFYTYWWLE